MYDINSIIQKAKEQRIYKVIIILTRVNLLYLEPEYVERAFKQVIEFLIELEDYETCAKLRDIQKQYKKSLKRQKKK
jgi:hypothetical protein